MRKLFMLLAFLFITERSFSQHSYYTILQGGGNLGLQIPDYEGTFNGYSLHFIFGRNLNEKAFLGLGLGNETLKGDYMAKDHGESDSKSYRYDRNLFPIFVDARLPFKDFGEASRIGIVANAGFAAKIGPIYDKGFLGKAGLFYLYDSLNKTKFTVSATYGIQQLYGNIYSEKFRQQQLNLSVGLMLK